jgi:hypothetical protein
MLQFTQALGRRDRHAAKPGTPLVASGVAEAAAAAQLLDRQARLGLPQEPDDLFSGKTAVL